MAGCAVQRDDSRPGQDQTGPCGDFITWPRTSHDLKRMSCLFLQFVIKKIIYKLIWLVMVVMGNWNRKGKPWLIGNCCTCCSLGNLTNVALSTARPSRSPSLKQPPPCPQHHSLFFTFPHCIHNIHAYYCPPVRRQVSVLSWVCPVLSPWLLE